jgi:hypothetical protein
VLFSVVVLVWCWCFWCCFASGVGGDLFLVVLVVLFGGVIF